MEISRSMTLFLCLSTNIMLCQVGVGTTNPTSELEIETTNTGIPALEINPQQVQNTKDDCQVGVSTTNPTSELEINP